MKIRENLEAFFGYYLFHPLNANHKVLTLTASISLGVLSGGIIHGICYLTLHDRIRKNFEAPASKAAQKVGSEKLVKTESPAKIDQEMEDIFKKKNIDTHQRRRTLYEFFMNENFQYKPAYYDCGIEDEFEVLWLDPKNAEDKEFLQSLYKKYPKEIEILSNSGRPTPDNYYFNMKDSSRFANNNIAELLNVYIDNPNIFKLLKETLRYCIIRNER